MPRLLSAASAISALISSPFPPLHNSILKHRFHSADFQLSSFRGAEYGMKLTVCRLLAEFVAVSAATHSAFAADPAALEQRLNALEAQNNALRDELVAQKQLIDDLQSRLSPNASTAT